LKWSPALTKVKARISGNISSPVVNKPGFLKKPGLSEIDFSNWHGFPFWILAIKMKAKKE